MEPWNLGGGLQDHGALGSGHGRRTPRSWSPGVWRRTPGSWSPGVWEEDSRIMEPWLQTWNHNIHMSLRSVSHAATLATSMPTHNQSRSRARENFIEGKSRSSTGACYTQPVNRVCSVPADWHMTPPPPTTPLQGHPVAQGKLRRGRKGFTSVTTTQHWYRHLEGEYTPPPEPEGWGLHGHLTTPLPLSEHSYQGWRH